MTRAPRRRVAIHVVLPLTLGVLVYFVFRRPDLRLFDWAVALGLGDAIDALRAATTGVRSLVPGVLVGSLPDGAWAYAFSASLRLVWSDASERGASIWWLVGAAIVSALELGQAAHVIPGRFDWADLALMLGGYLWAWPPLRWRDRPARTTSIAAL